MEKVVSNDVVPYSVDYRQMYSRLGYQLTARDSMAEARIKSAEMRLGAIIPVALRDYYFVAGCEMQFNCSFNRLLPPEEWSVDRQRLIFLEENQAVVLWGVPVEHEERQDCSVFVGVNGDRITWRKEHQQCSVFLAVMLHWHAAFAGGLPVTSTAFTTLGLRRVLRKSWDFVGEVNRMQAYARPGCCVCHLKWDDGWRVFAGATSPTELNNIALELGLTWLN